MRQLTGWFPFHRWRNWGPNSPNDLSEVSWCLSKKVMPWTINHSDILPCYPVLPGLGPPSLPGHPHFSYLPISPSSSAQGSPCREHLFYLPSFCCTGICCLPCTALLVSLLPQFWLVVDAKFSLSQVFLVSNCCELCFIHLPGLSQVVGRNFRFASLFSQCWVKEGRNWGDV